MRYNKHILFLNLLLLIGISSNVEAVCEYHHDMNINDLGKVALFAGVTAAGVYGLVKLGTWLFGASHDDIIRDAQDMHTYVSVLYEAFISAFYDAYHHVSDKESVVYDISEPVLYQLAFIKYRDSYKSIRDFLKQLNSNVSTLHNYRKEMIKRMRGLSHLDNIYQRMNILVDKITVLLPQIDLLYRYLCHHESYFALYDHEAFLLGHYERELSSLMTYYNNVEYLNKALHIIVMEKGQGSRYPYIQYLRDFDRQVHRLYRFMDGLAYNYYNRLGAARELSQRLEIIKNYIISSEYYVAELRASEHEKLELEKIELLRFQNSLLLTKLCH